MKVLEERAQEKNLATLDQLRQLVADLSREATSYANLIIVAGYAGAFALWQFVEKYISIRARFWSALLLIISIAIFAGHEIYKMIHEGLRLRSMIKAAIKLPPAQRFEVLQAILVRVHLEQNFVWLFFLVPTLATAFAAAAILAGTLVAKLSGYILLP